MKRKSVLIIVVSLLVATILGIGFYVEQSFKSETQVPTQSDSKSRKEYKSLTPKQKVEYKIKHLGLKNYSVLIIKNNKIWISDSKGNEDTSEYLINSVQKLMTAALIAKEAQNGKLQLSDKIGKWYPKMIGGNQVTVRNLISMTSGLATFENNILTEPYSSDQSDLNKHVSNTYLINTSLNKWHYNSLNYIYLSGILEKVENSSYEKTFRKYYIQPLKLKHTNFYWDEIESKDFLLGNEYSRMNRKFAPVNVKKASVAAHHMMGAGSVTMSNLDLATTLRYILSKRMLNERSKVDLYKVTKKGGYNGGFYNYGTYKSANGTGLGYYTFLRTDNTGKNIVIIQSNYTKRGKFRHYKRQIDKIWKETNK